MTNKVIYNDNVLIDLTSDTIDAENLMKGYTAHDKSGTVITGTLDPYKPEIIVIIDTSVASLSVGDSSAGVWLQPTYHEDNVWMYEIPYYGTWTVGVSSMFGNTSQQVVVDTVKVYKVNVNIAPNFNDASWSAIQYAVRNGYAPSFWEVGDTKEVTLSGNTSGSALLEIVNLPGNSLVLDLKDIIKSEPASNSNYSNPAYSWALNTFKTSLPSDLKSIITSFSWAFSYSEVSGDNAYSLFTTAAGRTKGSNWWLSDTNGSPSGAPSYVYNQYYIDTTGNIITGYSTSTYGVNPKIVIS